MRVCEIYDLLNELSPFALQEKWDNSGLNLGDPFGEVEQIYTTLEVDSSLAEKIEPNSLIIAHHPLIFSPLKTLNTQTYPSNLASILLAKNCSLIAMHTNFDATHLNPYFASEILGFENLTKKDFALEASNLSQDFNSLIAQIKKALNLPTLRAVKCDEILSSIFIVCGSGMSALPLIRPYSQSCLITGDIKHHGAMEAYSLGISLIDVGHFESEIFFAQIMGKILQKLGYEVIISPLENPLKFY